MAETLGPWAAIDDTEVDAESPITESLMTRLRDSHYAAMSNNGSPPASNSYKLQLPARAFTAELNANLRLRPDGGGGMVWDYLDTPAAMRTSQLDTGKYLRPNGAGEMVWDDLPQISITSHVQEALGSGVLTLAASKTNIGSTSYSSDFSYTFSVYNSGASYLFGFTARCIKEKSSTTFKILMQEPNNGYLISLIGTDSASYNDGTYSGTLTVSVVNNDTVNFVWAGSSNINRIGVVGNITG